MNVEPPWRLRNTAEQLEEIPYRLSRADSWSINCMKDIFGLVWRQQVLYWQYRAQGDVNEWRAGNREHAQHPAARGS